MMRGPRLTAMAVRNPRGEIVLEKFPTSSGKRPWPWRVPVIRGIFNFADSMIFGYRCLMRSAEISGLEDAEEEMRREKAERRAAREDAKKGTPLAATGDSNAEAIPPADAAPEDTAPAAQPDAEAAPEQSVAETPAHGKDGGKDKKTSPLMLAVTVVSIVLALALAVGLFIIVPTWLYACRTCGLAGCGQPIHQVDLYRYPEDYPAGWLYGCRFADEGYPAHLPLPWRRAQNDFLL